MIDIKYIGTFLATDPGGSEHRIHVFSRFHNGDEQPTMILRTDEGDRVDEISPGIFDMPCFGGPIRAVALASTIV